MCLLGHACSPLYGSGKADEHRCLHFTDGETEAQSGEMSRPKGQASKSASELGTEARAPDSYSHVHKPVAQNSL